MNIMVTSWQGHDYTVDVTNAVLKGSVRPWDVADGNTNVQYACLSLA